MSAQNVVHTLAEVPLLSTCSKSQLTELATRMNRRRYRKGESLMVEGQEGDEFFIIVKGSCSVLVQQAQSKQGRVATLGVGDYCGEQSLLSSNPRSATVQADGEVVVLVVTREVFQNLITQDFGITFAKRQAVCAEDLEFDSKDDKDDDVDRTKSPIERKWIWYTVSGNILFANLTASQKGAVIDCMYKKKVQQNELLIKEGDSGNLFYVIRQGKFEISKQKEGLLKLACPGDCVGELALLYGAPRAASVKCISSEAVVWCLHRSALRRAIKDEASKESAANMAFLKKVPILSSLLNTEISAIDSALEEEIFNKGDTVIKQGDDGDKFYIIKNGQAKIIKKGDTDTSEESVGKLSVGDYFGERALLTNDKRAATIVANTTQLTLLSLTRDKFNKLLGSLELLMSRNMVEYKRNLRMIAEKRRRLSLERASAMVFGDLTQLQIIGLLGRGGYGLVKLVKDPSSGKTYALKEVRKDRVLETHQAKHINDERKLMMLMDSAFLVRLWKTYQDENKVYFLLDACLGGDLFTILRKSHSFKEGVAKFYAGCVIEGFDHLHSMNMVYRDLKPENLVLNSAGYVQITDFGFCKQVEAKTFTLCGTPDYLSPEIIMGRGHGLGVDYWTLGILIYEMLASMPPFYDRDATNIYRKIIRSQPSFPGYFSSAGKDIIRKLLKKRPTERLGVTAGRIESIRKHAWFKGFDWNGLRNQKIKAPYKPKIKNDQDTSNFKCQKSKEKPFKPIKDQSAFKDF